MSIILIPLHVLKSMLKSALFAVLIISAQSLSAQHWGELGVVGGGSFYMGDLNPSKPFLMTREAFGILYRYNINQRLAVRVHALNGKLAADDNVSKADTNRNLNFISNVTEIGTQFEVNFFDYRLGSDIYQISPYMFGGFSYFRFNPKATVEGASVSLQQLRTEGQGSAYTDREPYKLWSFAIPFGLGLKISLGKTVGLGFEWGMRKTFTDYLDDVSKTYYLDLAGTNPSAAGTLELASDPALNHNKDMQRGNSHNNDWYSFAVVSLVFKIKIKNDERCRDNPF
jgi:hypothetical protein